MFTRRLSALVLVLLLFGASCTRQEKAPREVEGPTESFLLRKTGTTVDVTIDVEDPLIQEGSFACHETEITGEGSEAGKFTPEIEGGKVRHKNSKRFRAVIKYVIEAGGQQFSGTEEAITLGGSGISRINLKAPDENEDITEPGGITNFLHVPKGLTSCKLTISAA